MKQFLLLACLTNLLNQANAQNLVPDSSFEDYISCTFNVTSPTTNALHLKQWFTPTSGTADYFNACATNVSLGVPPNSFGYQAASDGNGYVGLFLPTDTNNYAEYVSCKLGGCASGDCPLTVEGYYRFSMDVSLAEIWGNTGSDALGAWFMIDTLPASFKTSLKTLPMALQVDFSSYGAITDTANWVTLVDTFVAIAPYKYIIIGGVKKFQDMNLVEVREFGHPIRRTYYYIDNVKLQQIPAPPPPPPPPLGVEAIAQPVATVSPNPIRDKAVIRISGLANAPYSFVLTDMLGQTVQQRSDILDEEIVLDRQRLPSGVYYYQVHTKNRTAYKGKLVLE